MNRGPAGRDLHLWQDVRARAVDAQLSGELRTAGERVAGWFRWLFLVAFAGLLGSQVNASIRFVAAAGILVAWAVVATVISVLLAAGHRPHRLLGIATMVMDLAGGAAITVAVLGAGSPVALAFFLVVIATSVRNGWLAPVAAAGSGALVYGIFNAREPLDAAGEVFLFLTVAAAVMLMSRELERERRFALRRAAEADSLRELSVGMDSSVSIDAVFRTVLERAVRMTDSAAGGMHVVTGSGVELVAGEPFPESAVRAAARGEGTLAADGSLLVNVSTADGVAAVLGLRRAKAFARADIARVAAVTNSATVPLANALRYQRTSADAVTDGLTGLLNRREFNRLLEREASTASPPALALIDIDNFKAVNDTLGHQQGDDVLRAAAALVRAVARNHDVVARYGGDEMAVIIRESSLEGAEALAARLVEAVRRAAIPAGAGRLLTFSIGVAAMPGDGSTAAELVTAADQALYVAKREGRDRACGFAEVVARMRDPAVLRQVLLAGGPQVSHAVAHAVDRHLGMPGRSVRAAALAESLAAAAGADRESVRACALLRDVALVPGVTGGAEHHARAGAELLAQAAFPAPVVLGVRHHHERWDGRGEPEGLAGPTIPPEARVTAAACAYVDAEADSGPAQAVDILAEAGGHDPALLAALRELATR